MRALSLSCLALAALLPACADGGARTDANATAGPTVAIDVAALNLQGVGDVVWDLEVDNGRGDVVWQRRVTSTSHGDSAGSASYVGPCDAEPAAAQNVVKVWVVGVYGGDVALADAGTFASGDASAVTGTALPFQNPTGPTTPLTRTVTCAANADAAARFDVALMRPAEQGFFDVAVSFNDTFCSAKFDCCADDAGDGCATDGSEDLDLLFDVSGQRARTMVLGFACTAGLGADVVTELYMDDLTLDCSAPNTGVDFAADVTIRPDAATNGNLCTAGLDGMTSCAPRVTESGLDADTVLFQVATYRGEERLSSGGTAAHKVYWNVALGVKASISSCRLRTQATADDSANTDDHVSGGVIAAGTVYPYVAWDVDLGTCGSEALSFGDATAPVTTAYTTTDGGATSFDRSYAPTAFDGADGSTAALAIASCDTLLTQRPAAVSGSYWIDPDGVETGVDAFYGYCEMAADGGWTLIMRGGTDPPTKATWNTTTAYAVATAASDGAQDGATFKLDDATINAFSGVYRVRTAGLWASTRYVPASCDYVHTANPTAECRYTCSDVGLSSCIQGAINSYGYGMHGGATDPAQACGIEYFATSSAPVYMTTPTSTYNIYWMVQTGTTASNANCHYGPGQRWYSSSANDDGTMTVWRR
ncbi:MAG: hypothetical protein CVU56_20320 [Deltaproteobacteria bacterium HGW-Deltaproteobacteria-14]|nr:MAG: hypothetical protein CVU56_20320 [Deltaproteobacteria bacterium HGW-Deltaproteobacteria-14]